MGTNEEIQQHLDTMAGFIVEKTSKRIEWAEIKAKITILIAKHLPKSSASFENKITMLLQIPELFEEMEAIINTFDKKEVEWKNARDFYELYKIKVIELQAVRKNLSNGL